MTAVSENCSISAHATLSLVPTLTWNEYQTYVRLRLSFRNIDNDHIHVNGPILSVKQLKHTFQPFHSKTKGRVDSTTKHHFFLQSTTPQHSSKYILVSQTFKTTFFNSFQAWRIYERQDILKMRQQPQTIDNLLVYSKPNPIYVRIHLWRFKWPTGHRIEPYSRGCTHCEPKEMSTKVSCAFAQMAKKRKKSASVFWRI